MGGALVANLESFSPKATANNGKKQFLNKNKSVERSKQRGLVAYKNESQFKMQDMAMSFKSPHRPNANESSDNIYQRENRFNMNTSAIVHQ